ncbi:L,D-transpeptidase [Marininema halotolerans]|uniref:L,D-transpeptidase catalytic domain n=1 Tax=Marininema halotolerans TaxID=1155944 RepID=A0A1I6NT10_9BACL|nr:L,D-transpeptidase [Marininema halotolerans]SFS31146.1 L,D-transpeptidase catalytic domain [Marininema halotolerans]
MYWIIVDLSARRLYLLTGQTVVQSWPVGIGKTLTQTPIGRYTIMNKEPYPFSHPGGRLSPYGVLWMGLSRKGYGIHGTNNPSSIGKKVSKGCIRMYNRDVETLSRYAPIGTHVVIRP